MRSSRSRRRPARRVSVRRGRARHGELSRTQWLCCAAWTWGRWSGKVGRGRRADVLVRLVDGVGLAMGGRRACCLLLFPGNCRASALDDTRRRGLHHRGLHCGCTGSRRRCVSTVNGCTHGGTGGGMGPGGRPRWQPATSGLPRSAAYGMGPPSHETGRPDVLLHRAAVVTAIISTLLSDGPASRVVRKPVARTPR